MSSVDFLLKLVSFVWMVDAWSADLGGGICIGVAGVCTRISFFVCEKFNHSSSSI